MTQKLTKLFSYEFNGIIWRSVLEPEQNLLILEIRDEASHQTTFSLLNLRKNSLEWSGLGFEEEWWISLSGIHQNIVLFHTLQDEKNPEVKNIFAMDVNQKEVLWALENYNHLEFLGEYSLGFSTDGEERYFSKVHLESGEVESLEEQEAGNLLALAKTRSEEAFKKNNYPVHYSEEVPYFGTVKEFVFDLNGEEVVKACDYLEILDKVVISYYHANREKLSNKLIVLNQEGEVLLEQLINEQIKGIGVDTFFVINHQLIFVKEKRILEAYEV